MTIHILANSVHKALIDSGRKQLTKLLSYNVIFYIVLPYQVAQCKILRCTMDSVIGLDPIKCTL